VVSSLDLKSGGTGLASLQRSYALAHKAAIFSEVCNLVPLSTGINGFAPLMQASLFDIIRRIVNSNLLFVHLCILAASLRLEVSFGLGLCLCHILAAACSLSAVGASSSSITVYHVMQSPTRVSSWFDHNSAVYRSPLPVL